MRITATGHAGLFIETAKGSVLCDPWRTPAYFASWFVFPDNTELDFEALAPDFLYISHLHRDHFDPVLLSRAVAKSTTVLLPEFPTSELRSALSDLGFHSFVETQNGEPVDLGGLRVMITAMVSPSDGPIGDSALSLDDGETRVLNQNDARPPDPAQLNAFGAYDGHFLQFSGAIWWPVVYELPEANKIEFAKRKRLNGMERARRFVDAVGARYVFPTAGPPCFLDENLFEHNDLENSPDNIFPDQRVFLAYLEESGLNNGRLLIPGSTASLTAEGCEVVHPLTSDEISSIFSDKTSYLKGLCRPTGAGSRASARLVAPLRRRPAQRPQAAMGAAIGVGRPHLRGRRCPRAARPRRGGHPRRLHDGTGAPLRRRRVPLPLHASTVAWSRRSSPRDEIDWVNSLFLSLRFKAKRRGPYNEYVFAFFKCLSPERMSYAEGLVRRAVERRRPRQARRLHGAKALPAPKRPTCRVSAPSATACSSAPCTAGVSISPRAAA